MHGLLDSWSLNTSPLAKMDPEVYVRSGDAHLWSFDMDGVPHQPPLSCQMCPNPRFPGPSIVVFMGCWKRSDSQHEQTLKGTNVTQKQDWKYSQNIEEMVKVWGHFFLKALPLSWKASRGMDGMYLKHFSTAVEGSFRLLCSHICELDSWMLRENYSLMCGGPDCTAASPYTIQTLPLRPIKDRSCHFFTVTRTRNDSWPITVQVCWQKLSKLQGWMGSMFPTKNSWSDHRQNIQ